VKSTPLHVQSPRSAGCGCA